HDIGRQDAYQRDIGEIVAFCYHLRPDEYVDVLIAEPVQYLLVRVFPGRGVHVHPDDGCPGKMPAQFLFHVLRARAELPYMAAAAVRACLRHPDGVAAVMAY